MLTPLTLAALLSVVHVQGDGRCPAPADVERAQQSLGTGEGEAGGHLAQLVELPDGLRLTLRSSSGVLLASREMRTRADCSQRAIAVAVVLSAWEAELAGAQQQVPVLPPPPSWNWRVGAEAAVGVTDHAGLRLLPTGALTGRLWLGDARWGALARVGSAWPARSPLASGEVAWIRPLLSVEAGPWFQLSRAGGSLQAEVTAGVALLRLWGEGYAVDHSSRGVDLGVSPGLRWILGRGAWRPELALGGTFWLLPQRVTVAGSAQQRVLPQWELRAGIGFSWGR